MADSLAIRLSPYAGHFGNCHQDSWKTRGRGDKKYFVKCSCGLFQLLEEVELEKALQLNERLLAALTEDTDELVAPPERPYLRH